MVNVWAYQEELAEEASNARRSVPLSVKRYVAHNVRNMLVRFLWLAGRVERGEDGRILAPEIREVVFQIREILDKVEM